MIAEETRKRLARDYRLMTDEELLYEFEQPDCPVCSERSLKLKEPLDHCLSCGVYRSKDSPLVKEMKRRGI